MQICAHSNQTHYDERGEHRKLASRCVLLVLCHIRNAGTWRFKVRDTKNLAIDLEDGGEVRVVGHQVNLQRIVDQQVAVSIPIAQLYCDMPW